jgi:hypothetical protein
MNRYTHPLAAFVVALLSENQDWHCQQDVIAVCVFFPFIFSDCEHLRMFCLLPADFACGESYGRLSAGSFSVRLRLMMDRVQFSSAQSKTLVRIQDLCLTIPKNFSQADH